MQLRTLAEQEREQNLEGFRLADTQRRLMLGQIGFNQFMNPNALSVWRPGDPAPARNLPPAQTAGGTLAPDLVDPAVAALQRREAMLARASGFGSTFVAATQSLAMRRRV